MVEYHDDQEPRRPTVTRGTQQVHDSWERKTLRKKWKQNIRLGFCAPIALLKSVARGFERLSAFCKKYVRVQTSVLIHTAAGMNAQQSSEAFRRRKIKIWFLVLPTRVIGIRVALWFGGLTGLL